VRNVSVRKCWHRLAANEDSWLRYSGTDVLRPAAIEPLPGQIALPNADIDAAEIAPLHPNVDVAFVNGDQEVEEV
jgi:hypothetical protein